MWTQSSLNDTTEGAGLFVAGSTDSAAGGDEKWKARKALNAMPVAIRQLLEYSGEGFALEGFESHVVIIVGLVTRVDVSSTRITMTLDDQTGVIDCVTYLGTEEDNKSGPTVALTVGTYGRIVGTLRKAKDGKYVVIFKAAPVTDLNELNCHLLEVVQTGISLKKLREGDTLKAPAPPSSDKTFSNSMIQAGLGCPTSTCDGGSTGGCGGNRGFTPNQMIILRIVSKCDGEQGMHKDQIISAARNSMATNDIMTTLEFLSNEGHLFSAFDDDHYRTVDHFD